MQSAGLPIPGPPILVPHSVFLFTDEGQNAIPGLGSGQGELICVQLY